MANLKNVIYLSNSDYETLVTTGTVTINGTTLTYDDSNVYITPEEVATTTENGLMSSSDKTKLDSISSQTAYTAKGSATKVPQITTNSYGQVTSITEVTITQPTTTSQLTNNSNFVSGTGLDSNYIVVGNGNGTVKKGDYTISELKDIAEGKTDTYVIATKVCITGTEDQQTGNFSGVSQILTAPSGGTSLDLTAMNIGDNIYIKETEVPDYWVSSKSTSNNVTTLELSKLETSKVDLTNYAPKSHATNATTYGVGTTTNYGHIKLKTGDMVALDYEDGVAASISHSHSDYYPAANPNGYISGITSTMVTNALGYTPGTSNFTGYSSSNKLSTDYINNVAGWASGTYSKPSGGIPASDLADSYLKLDGTTTMTGKLNLKATGNNDSNIGDNGIRWGTSSLPQDNAPQYFCTIDAFASGGRQKWASLASVKSALGVPSAVTESTVSGWGFTKNAGTVTSVNGVEPVNGNVTLTIASEVTESTVSGWGFTKNAGTVTSVGAGTGLSISGTSTDNPTVNVDSGYKLPTTNEWNNQDIDSWQADYTDTTNNFSVYRGSLALKKVYTGVIGVANGSATADKNTYANCSFYFLNVMPISWDAQWSIRYRLNVHLDDETQKYKASSGSAINVGQLSRGTYDCSIQGTGGVYNTFHFFQSQKNTSYRPIYYHMIHETTAAGFNANQPHKIGVSFVSAYLPTPVTDYSSGSAVSNTTYPRTIEVIVDEAINCTVTLNDTLEVEADAYRSDYTKLSSTYYTTNASSSNSAGRWVNLSATTQGLYESGDDNTYTYTQQTYNYLKNATKNGSAGLIIFGYNLIGFNKNGEALGISVYSSSQTSNTTGISEKNTRLYCTEGFDYTKGIRYTNSSSVFVAAADMNISTAINYTSLDLRYSDNCIANANASTLGMVVRKPVYLRGTIGSDGLFYLAPIDVTYNNKTYQRAWVQDGFETGYVYWFIGYPYYNSSYVGSGYQLDLFTQGELVEYVDGALRPYVGATGTVTSVRVQAGTGLSSSQSTAQTSTLNTTISIASGYKLPTTTEWGNKQDKIDIIDLT